ncbi:MAG TPA: gephyrin-like molybdotransferase Glp, partial [Bacteroidota bacterium]|nr:gephyrin-like molybdotransferase Glp [Bacteroidota bacterium]
QVLGEIAAGDASEKNLGARTAIHVMTGAPIPEGADAVVEQELTTIRNGTVLVPSALTAGRNIRRKGEDIRAGQIAVQKGRLLKAPEMGVLASIGISSLEVFRKPTVAILTSGNELVAVDSKLEPGKIRNSNAYSLLGLVKQALCMPVDLGIVPDDEEILSRKIKEGLTHDALITSGGVSVGKYDLMLKALENVGVVRKFWKVNIKPGGPFAFSVYIRKDQKIPVFSLPGNPVSTVVTFLELVLPGLMRLTGISSPSKRLQLRARLDHDIRKNDKKRHFSRGILRNEGGELFVKTTGPQSSGILTSMVLANCLIVIPEDQQDLKAGELVDVEIL